MNSELDNLVQNNVPTQPIEQTLSVQITIPELNVIMSALQELPHRVADPILKKLFTQAHSQINR